MTTPQQRRLFIQLALIAAIPIGGWLSVTQELRTLGVEPLRGGVEVRVVYAGKAIAVVIQAHKWALNHFESIAALRYCRIEFRLSE